MNLLDADASAKMRVKIDGRRTTIFFYSLTHFFIRNHQMAKKKLVKH